MFKQLISKIEKLILGYETGNITFSQAGEDLIIRNYYYTRLIEKQKGFYIDIGAYHPYKLSNTFYLYLCGWRGINLDPRPGSMKLFNKLRPQDINLELAVSDKKDKLKYYFIDENSSMNSFSLDYIESLNLQNKIKQIIEIEPVSLSEIFQKHLIHNQKIDFMNIDVEGLDYEVLNSNDWENYRPELIAIEIEGDTNKHILESKTASFLFSKHYDFYTKVPLSMKNINTVFFIDSKIPNP